MKYAGKEDPLSWDIAYETDHRSGGQTSCFRFLLS